MIDLKRTWASSRLARPIAAGIQVQQEGVLLCSVLQNGVEAVTVVPTVAGAEKVVGFAYHASALPSQTSNVEQLTVPASGTLILALNHHNLVAGDIYVYDQNALAALTPVAFAGAPAAGQVGVDPVGGQLKFNAAQAGHSILVTYVYSLTVVQAIQQFGQRSINNLYLHETFGQIEAGMGDGELYTDQFDASQNYSSGSALTLGNNGIITIGGAGPVLNAVVCNIPSVDIPVLGVRFHFGAVS